MERPLAFFDLDGTILDRDCELLWCEYLLELGIVDEAFLRDIHAYDDDFDNGTMDYPSYDRTLLQPLMKMEPERAQKLLQSYLPRLEPHTRFWMVERVSNHKRDGYDVVLATASIHFLAEPIAQLFGLPHVICTRVEMKDGRPTGSIVGRESFFENKTNNIKVWIKGRPLPLHDGWAYSDSRYDIPMFNLVEHPVAVTPDAQLRAHAVANGWTILEKSDGHNQA